MTTQNSFDSIQINIPIATLLAVFFTLPPKNMYHKVAVVMGTVMVLAAGVILLQGGELGSSSLRGELGFGSCRDAPRAKSNPGTGRGSKRHESRFQAEIGSRAIAKQHCLGTLFDPVCEIASFCRSGVDVEGVLLSTAYNCVQLGGGWDCMAIVSCQKERNCFDKF